MSKDKKAKTGPTPKVDPSEVETKQVTALAPEPATTSEISDVADDAAAKSDDKAKRDTAPFAKLEPETERSTRTTGENVALQETVDEPTKVAERPMVTSESPRARTMTLQPDVIVAAVGKPPAMPTTIPPINLSMGGVEDPTHMPAPKDIPDGHPHDPAAAPGKVPPGDSRSFRKVMSAGTEFALVYRQQTFVITRSGTIGTRGQWRVVEYPTSASASHAYAKECSRFVSDGFSDYRD